MFPFSFFQSVRYAFDDKIKSAYNVIYNSSEMFVMLLKDSTTSVTAHKNDIHVHTELWIFPLGFLSLFTTLRWIIVFNSFQTLFLALSSLGESSELLPLGKEWVLITTLTTL